jgi:hypothetical protein
MSMQFHGARGAQKHSTKEHKGRGTMIRTREEMGLCLLPPKRKQKEKRGEGAREVGRVAPEIAHLCCEQRRNPANNARRRSQRI